VETDQNRMAALMLGLPDVHVLKVEEDSLGLRVEVETAADVAHCPRCGEPATPRDPRTVQSRPAGVRQDALDHLEGARVAVHELGLFCRLVVRGDPADG